MGVEERERVRDLYMGTEYDTMHTGQQRESRHRGRRSGLWIEITPRLLVDEPMHKQSAKDPNQGNCSYIPFYSEHGRPEERLLAGNSDIGVGSTRSPFVLSGDKARR